jgi:small subunit ribosomal protein S17
MAETEDQENQVEEPQAEAPPEDAAPEAEAPAEEAAPEETPAAEAPAAEAAPAAEPEEQLTPKEQRKRERSRAKGPAGPQRSVEDRAAERAQLRARRAAERLRWRRRRRERDRAAGAPAPPTPPEPRARGASKVRRGVVVSAKPDKTITVRIDIVRPHRRYGKIMRNTSTLHAHDESNQANEGDIVRIVETRPLSRTKHWRLLEVVERAR